MPLGERDDEARSRCRRRRARLGTHVLFTVDAPPVDVAAVRDASDDRERATLLATDTRALFTAEVSESTVVRPGERLCLALDSRRFHFFDRESGERMTEGALTSSA